MGFFCNLKAGFKIAEQIVDRVDVKLNVLSLIIVTGLAMWGCNAPTSVSTSQSTAATTTTGARFAAGTKYVKIITSDLSGGSFAVPSTMPVSATPIPSPFPGYDTVTTYHPGLSASTYYDMDGITVIPQPTWLQDFQLGVSGLPGSATCATFGGSSNEDVNGYYRTSEVDCGAATNIGTGNSLTDQVFIRLVLNRDSSVLGTAENLMMQVEYQSAGLHLNSDGIDLTNPENNLDQLWKILWNSSLAPTSPVRVFSMFVPPNYAACLPGGSGTTNVSSSTNNCVTGYPGPPTSVKQVIIPLSAYPAMNVVQLTRMKGRINHATSETLPNGNPVNYVTSFFSGSSSVDCQTNSPLCLGVVIRSISLMRM